MDGWNDSKTTEARKLYNEIYNAFYEINNSVRGCYTGCETYADLGKYLKDLGERLTAAGEEISNELEDEPEYELEEEY